MQTKKKTEKWFGVEELAAFWACKFVCVCGRRVVLEKWKFNAGQAVKKKFSISGNSLTTTYISYETACEAILLRVAGKLCNTYTYIHAYICM